MTSISDDGLTVEVSTATSPGTQAAQASQAGKDGRSRQGIDRWAKRAYQATILTSLTTIAGLLLVWMQLRANGEALHASTIEQIYSRMHDVNGQFVQHPEWRPYFYEGLAIHEPNELIAKLGLNEDLVRAQIPPLAEMMCDFFAQALLELKNLPPAAYAGWQSYIKEIYKRSPAMRDYYHQNIEWYQYDDAARLFDAADQELLQMMEAQASPAP